MDRANFIHDNKYYAIKSTLGTKLLPSVFMAQAILESGNGESILSSEYNNYFGIKAGSEWKGKTVNIDTIEVYNGRSYNENASFRVYSNTYQSFIDRVKFLTEKYPQVMQAVTPQGQAEALQKSGYATDPNYSDKILQIISDNNLILLDKQKETMKTLQTVSYSLLIIIALIGIYTLYN